MAKTTSKSKTSYYSVYKSTSRWKSNRERRLLKLLKTQPENKDIKRAIDNIVYRRKAPKASVWSKSNIRQAQLIKEFSGRCPHEIFSSNPKVSGPALQSTWRTIPQHEVSTAKVSFRLGDRSHGVGN
jgi:hypothetical protein